MEAARPFLKKLPKDHKFAVETATKTGSQRALREVRFFKFSHRRTAWGFRSIVITDSGRS
jgi:hypothetical protein